MKKSQINSVTKSEKLTEEILANMNLAVSNELMFFRKRLETFTQDWPFTKGSCAPEHMAHAGFYYLQDDCAKCAFCGKELDGWEETDDPWEEHKSHKKDCPFVILNKKDLTTWTLQEFLNMNMSARRTVLMTHIAAKRQLLVQKLDQEEKNIMATCRSK